MAADEIHFGDVNTQFQQTIKDGTAIVDVSAATTKEIKLKGPTGVTKVKTASFLTDGIDGVITYNTVANDLDEIGLWEIQSRVVVAGGDFHSDVGRFEVHANL